MTMTNGMPGDMRTTAGGEQEYNSTSIAAAIAVAEYDLGAAADNDAAVRAGQRLAGLREALTLAEKNGWTRFNPDAGRWV